MNRIVIDARGLACPQPIIETKRAIDALTVISEIEVLVDNKTSLDNVADYLTQLGITPIKGDESVVFTSGVVDTSSSQISCSVGGGDNYCVVVNRLTMGSGSDELGQMLMKAFFSTIAQTDNLPTHMVFYNEGVKYCSDDSSVIEVLRELENRGVMHIICGTCVDYFAIKESISIGVVSNMYKIVETLQSAPKVVYP